LSVSGEYSSGEEGFQLTVTLQSFLGAANHIWPIELKGFSGSDAFAFGEQGHGFRMISQQVILILKIIPS